MDRGRQTYVALSKAHKNKTGTHEPPSLCNHTGCLSGRREGRPPAPRAPLRQQCELSADRDRLI